MRSRELENGADVESQGGFATVLIEAIQRARRSGLGFHEVARAIGISPASAYKYARNVSPVGSCKTAEDYMSLMANRESMSGSQADPDHMPQPPMQYASQSSTQPVPQPRLPRTAEEVTSQPPLVVAESGQSRSLSPPTFPANFRLDSDLGTAIAGAAFAKGYTNIGQYVREELIPAVGFLAFAREWLPGDDIEALKKSFMRAVRYATTYMKLKGELGESLQ